ncbi:uncharacterized protein F5Z01DRAFT_233045 [Emericellopsis atlantica]|uniref:Uncharacterized protein n=1 Tax=Emericellopsis atlantica TaxID=2614577 RepID=A0A9P8CMZ7_9HYPO|nr:uncharacterized protein F5Z01DRAFT_233045 [Emericellopsis atlantica]KAG9252540.1 hypothetical protein F5Z01DRAFT_233045 [Emericellopsis atlantica]
MDDSTAQKLRSVEPREQALILRKALDETNAQTVTGDILHRIQSGSLPPRIVQRWLSVSRSAAAAAMALRESRSVSVRDEAIAWLGWLSSKQRSCEATWKALGGVEDLAALMSTLSTRHLKELCRVLGRPTTGLKDSETLRFRQKRVTELFDFVTDPSRNVLEKRPVRQMYGNLLPACSPERIAEWLDKLDNRRWRKDEATSVFGARTDEVERAMYKSDIDFFERRAMRKLVDSDRSIHVRELKPFVEQGVSFGIQVMEAIGVSKSLRGMSPREFMVEVVLPTVRRVVKHRMEYGRRVWDALNACLAKHEGLRTHVGHIRTKHSSSFTSKDVCIMRWAIISRNRTTQASQSDDQLATMIALASEKDTNSEASFDLWLRIARPDKRYRLLQLFMKHTSCINYDIGTQDCASPLPKTVRIPLSTLPILPPVDSLNLFERATRPEKTFKPVTGKECPSFLSAKTDMQNVVGIDANVVHAYLIQRAGGLEETSTTDRRAIITQLSTSELDRRRKLSAQGRTSIDRAFWALSAVQLAVAIGDLGLLDETLLWCRRFLKDPLNSIQLYGGTKIPGEVPAALKLEDNHMRLTRESVCEFITASNKIVTTLIKTAVLAKSEPSFQLRHWLPTLEVITAIFEDRLLHTGLVVKRLKLSNEECFDYILKPTIDLVIDMESLLLQEENKNLYHPKPGGLAQFHPCLDYKTHDNEVYWYVNYLEHLAVRRDELWTQHRVKSHPKVAELDRRWPRGLPLQYLMPSSTAVDQLRRVPYLVKRAESLVLGDPELLLTPLPEDKDTIEAIGHCIDSWDFAVKVWVNAEGESLQSEAKKSRLLRAWHHATVPLSKDQTLDQEQLYDFWADHGFRQVIENNLVTIDRRRMRFPPRLPTPGSSDDVVEYDPDPNGDDSCTSTAAYEVVVPTYLGALLQIARVSNEKGPPTWADTIVQRRAISPLEGFFSQFDLYTPSAGLKLSTMTVEAVDALAATALAMYSDGKVGDADGVLQTPFPSYADCRFPRLRLKEDFLKREKDQQTTSRGLLGILARDIPPTILVTLAESYRTQLTVSDKPLPAMDFVDVIKLLIQSDDPTLATPYIRDFVLSTPGDSAWHRQLLNAQVMGLLDAKSAEELYTSMAKFVLQGLREDPAPSKEGKADDGKVKTPHVKVTTVKMLAQLPKTVNSLPTSVCLQALRDIAKASSHIDIRSAALDSIRNLPDEASIVSDFLRTWGLQTIGELSERRVLSEEDWIRAENGGDTPEIALQADERPMMGLFMTGNQAMNEIALEASHAMAEKYQRWMRIFARRLGVVDLDVPPVSPCPQLFSGQLSPFINRKPGARCASMRDFELARNYLRAHANPPAAVANITKLVKSDSNLKVSNAGKHWLAMWDAESLQNQSFLLQWACDYIQPSDKDREPSPDEVPQSTVEDLLFDLLMHFVKSGDMKSFRNRSSRLLRAPSRKPVAGVSDHSSLIRRLIEGIDNMRTDEWNIDPERKPARLPDTLPWKLQLLYFSPLADGEGYLPSRKNAAAYVDGEIIPLLTGIARQGWYVEQFRMLESKLMSFSGKKLGLATVIGQVHSPMSLLDILRVRLASAILQAETGLLADEDAGDADAARRMISDWEQCPLEEIREQTVNVREKTLAGKKGKRQKTWLDDAGSIKGEEV